MSPGALGFVGSGQDLLIAGSSAHLSEVFHAEAAGSKRIDDGFVDALIRD